MWQVWVSFPATTIWVLRCSFQRDRVYTLHYLNNCPTEIKASMKAYIPVPKPAVNSVTLARLIILDPSVAGVEDITIRGRCYRRFSGSTISRLFWAPRHDIVRLYDFLKTLKIIKIFFSKSWKEALLLCFNRKNWR